jgi:hypothetical protein
LCMAGGPGLEPVWRWGGDPDYAVSAPTRVVYTVSDPKSVVRNREAAPGLPSMGSKPCRLHGFGPETRSLVPISTPAPDLAPRPYTRLVWEVCGWGPSLGTSLVFWGKVRPGAACTREQAKRLQIVAACQVSVDGDSKILSPASGREDLDCIRGAVWHGRHGVFTSLASQLCSTWRPRWLEYSLDETWTSRLAVSLL